MGFAIAEAAAAVAGAAGIALEHVDAVASHGQTVGHYPEQRATLQIGDPAVVDSILDPVVHSAYRIELQGESIRKRFRKPSGEGSK